MLRWLLIAMTITFTLLILADIALPRGPAIIYQHLPKLNPVASLDQNLSSGTTSTLHDFWRAWSRIIHETRPQAAAITLLGTAATEFLPPRAENVRTPYADLVRNQVADIDALHDAHARYVKELASHNVYPDTFRGRGVVVVGGGEYFGPAIIGIHMLRRSGSELPVEVFVPNEKEYNPTLCERYLVKLNAKCLILDHVLKNGAHGIETSEVSHYQYKALAILFSSFEEVLLLDSDSIPLVDPAKELFATEQYNSTGLVIWPDFWVSTESPRFWSVAGLPGMPSNLPRTSSETGQLLINKRTHLRTLLLATYYNIYGPKYYYPLLSQGALGQGDKETFMAAAAVLNAPFHRVQAPVEALGRNNGREEKGTAMVQYLLGPGSALTTPSEASPAPEVRPAFLHCNTPKMNAAHLIDEGDLLSVDGKTRLRLLGEQREQIDHFGFDLERALWELLVQTGCELADTIREWKTRDRLCERLEEHYAAVFSESDSNP